MAKKHNFDYDLIVIGSGAGGSVAADIVAKSKLKVALVEEAKLGGDAANYGDVPMRALLDTAHLYRRAKRSDKFGLRVTTMGHNYPSIRRWKDTVVERTGVSEGQDFYKRQGIDLYRGKAHFLTPREITVNKQHLSSKYFLIATGANWITPKIPGIENVDLQTPRSIVEFLKPPKTMLVIGSGRYGTEVAELMGIFGTKVYLVEEATHILPDFDKEAGDTLANILSAHRSVTVLTGSKILSISRNNFGYRVLMSRGGANKHVDVDEIVNASDYLPNIDLGLSNASVVYDKSGIPVDKYLRTNAKHIYVAGDAIGQKRDTSATFLESQIVAKNIINGAKYSPDYSSIPRAIFTLPEVASVGLTDKDAKKQNLKTRHASAPLSMVARSNVVDITEGFVKITTDKQGLVLGGTIVAPHATELIQEVTSAVHNKLSIKQLSSTPHVFMSWSESIRVVAQKLLKDDIVE